ncbi:Arylsulfatase [Stieleria maiorica]|uniref:Arylsulfatase n=1 Tax=Stieleria maiorica TaxID=2795974 RepID=A0A5B9MET8_9BACT|nr:sulfatase-like hydrolase/transferase [Stieleria maiorica]QEF99782.1 Arylsulfatase [Stieleria maiorica]
MKAASLSIPNALVSAATSKPRYLTRWSVLTLVFLTATLCRADDRPSFILLMGDDHGWSETGYNGHPYLQTPVLDEMARSGLRLDHFYSGHPSCSPTRGSVLTGRHPNRYGTFSPGWSIRPKEITIAHLLSEAGYRCGHFGKWHLGPVKSDSPTNPRAMGFDEYVSHDNFYEMNPPFSRNGDPPQTIRGEGSEVTIDETIKFIDRARADETPFLAVVWFGSPHEPYSGLDKDLALYDDLPQTLAERTVRLTSMETGKQTTRPLRDVLRERYAEITAMDRSIGTLRDYLADKGLRDNTLIWYCGDNGSPRSSGRVTTPFRGEKGLMYEGGIRVPGLIEWPARIATSRVSEVNSVTSDMLPTLCELAGVQTPDRPLDGISIVPVIDGKMTQRPKPICFWSYPTKRVTAAQAKPKPYIDPAFQEGTTPLVKEMAGKLTRSFNNYHQPEITDEDYAGPRVILDNRFKLVVDASAKDPTNVELFDLHADREEATNLAQSNAEVTERLSRQLRTWQTSVLNSLQEADY